MIACPTHRYERARDGDRSATEDIVESLRPRLTRMAVYYARRTGEDADDLLQEAWMGALDALPGLNLNIGAPDQYLIQRARWRLLDAIKRARVRRSLSLIDDPLDSSTCPVIEMAVSAAHVAEFAHQLKATQRAVFACLFVGFTWRETGALLGCTSANIAYHVRQIQRRYAEWAAE